MTMEKGSKEGRSGLWLYSSRFEYPFFPFMEPVDTFIFIKMNGIADGKTILVTVKLEDLENHP